MMCLRKLPVPGKQYKRVYRLLRMVGHGPVTAAEIILDFRRKEPYAHRYLTYLIKRRHSI